MLYRCKYRLSIGIEANGVSSKVIMESTLSALITDPDPIVLEGLGIRLENAGFSVIYADSGKDALEKTLTIQPTLVMTEVELVDMTGIQLITAIRQNSPDQACFFYTSTNTNEYFKAATIVGASGFLSKAMPLDSVVANILVTANHHLQRQAKQASAQKSFDNMERAIQSRRLQDNLVGFYMGLWGTEADETKSILVKFSRSNQISFEDLAMQQAAYSKSRADLQRKYKIDLEDATPQAITKLNQFHIEKLQLNKLAGIHCIKNTR